jgi:hypothetical protein
MKESKQHFTGPATPQRKVCAPRADGLGKVVQTTFFREFEMAAPRNCFRPHVAALGDRELPSGLVDGWVIRQDGNLVRAVGVRLAFNQALDPTQATDPNTYTLEGSDGKKFRPIPVRQAVQDVGPGTLRLLWRQPATLRVLRKLRVTVHGDVPAGLTNAGGQLLDGDQDGVPGGDAHVLLRPRPGQTVQIPGSVGDPGLLRLLAATLL